MLSTLRRRVRFNSQALLRPHAVGSNNWWAAILADPTWNHPSVTSTLDRLGTARSFHVPARFVFHTFGCLGSLCCWLVVTLLKDEVGRMKDDILGGGSLQVLGTGWPIGQSLARRWPVPCAEMITGYVFFGRLARLAKHFGRWDVFNAEG